MLKKTRTISVLLALLASLKFPPCKEASANSHVISLNNFHLPKRSNDWFLGAKLETLELELLATSRQNLMEPFLRPYSSLNLPWQEPTQA